MAAQPPAGAAKPPTPALSAVTLGAKRFGAAKGTKLKLTVSQASQVNVRITQTVKARKVKGQCKRRAKTGKRCTTTRTNRRLTFAAQVGANAFRLKLRGLAQGAYTATIIATNPSGTSRPTKLTFKITHK